MSYEKIATGAQLSRTLSRHPPAIASGVPQSASSLMLKHLVLQHVESLAQSAVLLPGVSPTLQPLLLWGIAQGAGDAAWG